MLPTQALAPPRLRERRVSGIADHALAAAAAAAAAAASPDAGVTRDMKTLHSMRLPPLAVSSLRIMLQSHMQLATESTPRRVPRIGAVPSELALASKAVLDAAMERLHDIALLSLSFTDVLSALPASSLDGLHAEHGWMYAKAIVAVAAYFGEDFDVCPSSLKKCTVLFVATCTRRRAHSRIESRAKCPAVFSICVKPTGSRISFARVAHHSACNQVRLAALRVTLRAAPLRSAVAVEGDEASALDDNDLAEITELVALPTPCLPETTPLAQRDASSPLNYDDVFATSDDDDDDALTENVGLVGNLPWPPHKRQCLMALDNLSDIGDCCWEPLDA